MKVGILTAGGDCPGLNAVIRAASRRLLHEGHEPIGLIDGYRGLAECNYEPLDRSRIRGILHLGGTILGTSSFNPYREERGLELVKAAVEEDEFDAIIAIGGEHTMMMTRRLYLEDGIPTIGVPKTIDNDVVGTDFTFGFDTAVQIATDAIDRLHTTADSHDRIIVLEVMGRNSGWIATFSAIAGGADGLVVPEFDTPVEEIAAALEKRHDAGANFSIIVAAEGANLAFASGESRQIRANESTDGYGYPRLGGIGAALAEELERLTGFESRVTVLGHTQRGGTPTAHDRVLATRYGICAADCAIKGEFGHMAALIGSDVVSVPLSGVTDVKTIDMQYVDVARNFFG
ncbi:MAG: ATP-dependent 6-phosphofructokinase [Solirubrobacterales bacterium]